MKISLRDISSKKYGTRTLIQVNIKSLENVDLFVKVAFKKVCRCGYNCKEYKFHDLLRSTRNLKYFMNYNVGEAENLLNIIRNDYYKELVKEARYNLYNLKEEGE